MRFRTRAVPLLIGLLAVCPALADASHAGRARLYRLEPHSTFQRGCFDPCLCPILEAAPLRGTFRLELAAIGDVFDFYEVSHVAWKAHLSNSTSIPVAGAGHYQVSTIADLQLMSLDLAVGDDAPEAFGSDYVDIPVAFPRIDLTISIHGGWCYDTVLELHARPTMRLRGRRNDLSWSEEAPDVAPWDVVYGDLHALRASGGDFAAATMACLVRDYWDTALPWPGDPAPGQAWWFLARRAEGTFADGAPEQVGDPDGGIAGSNAACR